MKNILLIVLCLFIASCDENAQTKEEDAERVAQIIERAKSCRDHPNAFYKVNNVVVKIPRNEIRYTRLQDDWNVGRSEECESSNSAPISASVVAATTRIEIEKDLAFLVQYSVRATSDIPYNKVLKKLAEDQTDLGSSPEMLGFYRVNRTKNSYYYIAKNPKLVDKMGNPIVLTSISDLTNSANMSTTLMLDENVGFSFQIASIEGERNLSEPLEARFIKQLSRYNDLIARITVKQSIESDKN